MCKTANEIVCVRHKTKINARAHASHAKLHFKITESVRGGAIVYKLKWYSISRAFHKHLLAWILWTTSDCIWVHMLFSFVTQNAFRNMCNVIVDEITHSSFKNAQISLPRIVCGMKTMTTYLWYSSDAMHFTKLRGTSSTIPLFGMNVLAFIHLCLND